MQDVASFFDKHISKKNNLWLPIVCAHVHIYTQTSTSRGNRTVLSFADQLFDFIVYLSTQ